MAEQWNSLARDAMNSPSLEIFRIQVDLFSEDELWAESWARWLAMIPSNLYNSMSKVYKENQTIYSGIFHNIHYLSTGGKLLFCIKLWKKEQIEVLGENYSCLQEYEQEKKYCKVTIIYQD